MKWNLSIALGVTALFSFTRAHNSSEPNEQTTVSAPHGNVWKVLSEEEIIGINALLQDSMNLSGDLGSSQDSYIVQLVHLQPNKTDVLSYLDRNATQPKRYARATVQIGATDTTDVYWQEYMIGPLPVTNSTTVAPLTYLFNNARPGRTAVHPVFSANDGLQFQLKLATEVDDIARKIWNASFLGGELGVRFGTPFWNEDGRIISWAPVFALPSTNVSSSTLLPLGAAAKVDLTGRNWQEWEIAGWYVGKQYYNSTEQFRAALNSTDWKVAPADVDGDWTSTDMRGMPLPLDNLPPLVPVSQGSPRFKVDAEEGYVSWMDFAFFHTVSHDIGVSLFDVHYKGRRLLYELSLQEALTAYAGSRPFSSQTTFFDTITGMGSTLQPLIKGYDCPSHATYLPATWTEGNETMTMPDAICMFEFDTGYPIRRHSFAPTAPYTSVAKNIQFTLRTVATVGNYDFLIDYTFGYDGAIEVSARASGYISAAYWDNEPEYGFHIHDYLSGSLHDHTLTFKADFDINGTANSVQKVEFVPTSTTYPWSQGVIHNTFKANRSFVANESESCINWHDNDNVMYAVVNKDTPNRFGEYPGYRMKRSAGTIRLTQTNSTNIRKTGAYATHDFYVTQQKDSEPRAADAYNQYEPEDPLVDFETFLDGESLEQEDLVLWFNLGMHHMPHTGDLPVTMFSSAHSGMRFEPFNYLEGDPSVASNQQVRVEYNEDGSVESVEEFGKR
ncbi:amine oxidase catalytic domain-containing protein [Decorospora gaudefroyi]|uniref:Amine oxidase n=1 Tax=Decorospora gaudefroyi TaxID=184978 RepID=A0A6A5KT38_9PLEO|nr:amine oxidase catalytic domain-containing protein [Decorospora gaudefroyi]